MLLLLCSSKAAGKAASVSMNVKLSLYKMTLHTMAVVSAIILFIVILA